HRRLDVLQPLFQRFDGADHVETLARAARAGDDTHAAAADAEPLEDFVANANLFLGLRRQRDPNRVADPGPQQRADSDCRLDGSSDQPAGLGNPEVKRAVDLLRELLIGRNRKEYVRGFDRDLVLAEIMVLEDSDMVERALDQSLGAWLAIFLQEVLLEASGIDPDADRAAVRLRCGNDLLHALLGADIARVDAQARGSGVGRLKRSFIVKVDVGDDRDPGCANDLLERGGAVGGRARHADDVGARILAAADLVN